MPDLCDVGDVAEFLLPALQDKKQRVETTDSHSCCCITTATINTEAQIHGIVWKAVLTTSSRSLRPGQFSCIVTLSGKD